ncbi:MAG: hypothetical protein HYU39_07530 [Thaumarchaeota archaeon]|nr:hypothetical protein [Nitrososphaerota archaeon]
MHTPRVWIAIPDSILTDTPSLREKTVKMGTIARAAAIFKVTQIYLYHHRKHAQPQDSNLIHDILEYLNTPQYLRKTLYPMKKEFAYTGLLPPLRTPAHTVPTKPEAVKTGDYRQGTPVPTSKGLQIDAGLPHLMPFQGRAKKGERITVRITSTAPFECEISDPPPTTYWGYKVVAEPSLTVLLNENKADATLLTSRKGQNITHVWPKLIQTLASASTLLVIFGSTKQGIFEIMSEEGMEPSSVKAMSLNTFPQQGTATVRVEEALLGSLAILNTAAEIARPKTIDVHTP